MATASSIPSTQSPRDYGPIKVDAEAAEPLLKPLDKKVQAVACQSICRTVADIGIGLSKSKIFRAVVLTVAVALLVAFLVSNPVGWLVSGIGVTLFIAKILFYTVCSLLLISATIGVQVLGKNRKKNIQKLAFEFAAVKRFFKKENFNEIQIPGVQFPHGNKLILSALPNKLNLLGIKKKVAAFFGKWMKSSREWHSRLEAREKVIAAISINEPWEREPLFLSIPFRDKDWEDLGVHYVKADVQDHEWLTSLEMDALADQINIGLNNPDENTLVHCRAGVGRSSTAIAAYLMKYARKDNGDQLSIEEICHYIVKSRKDATIWNKLPALIAYNNSLAIPLPISPQIQAMADKIKTPKDKSSEEDIALASAHLIAADLRLSE